MPIDVSGFVSKPQEFEGLYRAGEQLQQNRLRDEELKQRQDVQKQATTSWAADYLDNSNFLSGTNLDPAINDLLKDAKQTAFDLANKGADKATIAMALGDKVAKIYNYSSAAKNIDTGIKNSVSLLKKYSGYNPDAIDKLARQAAYDNFKQTGKIDPDTNWVDYAIKNNRLAVTNNSALEEAVSSFKNVKDSRNVTTKTGIGQTVNNMYAVDAPPWMDFKRNSKGEIIADEKGNPVGMEVIGTTIQDKNVPMLDVKPEGNFLRSKDGVLYDKDFNIINEKTGKPFRVMDEGYFNALVSHNPDTKDRIDALVEQHFKDEGHKPPKEDSEAWNLVARGLLLEDLEKRGGYSFKVASKENQTGFADKMEAWRNPETKVIIQGIANAGDNNSGGSKTDVTATLDEYPVVEGKKDITDIFDGVVVGKDEYGKGIMMENVLFDPATKKISYNGKPPVSIAKFIQDNRLQGKELKIAQSLERYKMSDKKEDTPKKTEASWGTKLWNGIKSFGSSGKQITKSPASNPAKKEIKRADIKSKAEAAGYSEAEYEQLLKKNKIKIID